MKKVQIVMPCINLWKSYTKPAIDSIQTAMVYAKKHDIECRLLVIDNASTDETREEAGKYVSERFAHQRNEERWGFQKSVNFGVNDALERGYDLVLVCNNDILLHPEAIWRLAERFDNPTFRRPVKHEHNVALSEGEAIPDMVVTVEEVPLAMATAMDMRGQVDPADFAQVNANSKEEVPESPHPNFSAFMLSKECWIDVGEFDEEFAPAYFEDNDYHYRIGLAGMEAITYPPALFYHFASKTNLEASETGLPMISNGMFENNRAAYARKWGGLPGQEVFKTPYDKPDRCLWHTKQ